MLVDLHELEQGALETYAQRAVESDADAAYADMDCTIAARDANPLTASARSPCGSSEADFAHEYWRDPRIHSFGNMGVLGAVHAGGAPRGSTTPSPRTPCASRSTSAAARGR